MSNFIHRRHLEKFEPDHISTVDRRTRVAWAVFSYIDRNSIEYRKAFEAKRGTPESNFWQIAPLKIQIQ